MVKLFTSRAHFGKKKPGNEVVPQALMGLFGGTGVKTNMAKFRAKCYIAWIVVVTARFLTELGTCSNKIERIEKNLKDMFRCLRIQCF